MNLAATRLTLFCIRLLSQVSRKIRFSQYLFNLVQKFHEANGTAALNAMIVQLRRSGGVAMPHTVQLIPRIESPTIMDQHHVGGIESIVAVDLDEQLRQM